MRCEKYHAIIPECTCIARQKQVARKRVHPHERGADPGCRNCAQGLAVMAAHEKGEEVAVKTSKKTTTDTNLTINFAKCPEILERIAQVAADEERSPDRQVLYWLKNCNFDRMKQSALVLPQ